MYLKDSRDYDYFVSPSAFCTKVFTTAFGLDRLHKEHILIESGYPRNDYLLTHKPKDAVRIREELHIPKDKKSSFMLRPGVTTSTHSESEIRWISKSTLQNLWKISLTIM